MRNSERAFFNFLLAGAVLTAGLLGSLKMKKLTIRLFSFIAFLLVFSVLIMNTWEYGRLLQVDQLINVVKMLENEPVSDRLLQHLHGDLSSHYCELNEDKQSLVYKYTLDEQFSFLMGETEGLFNAMLKPQHEQWAGCLDGKS